VRWASRRENNLDKRLDGTDDQNGEKNPNAKLNKQQVQEMRTRYAAGNVTQTELAKEYGISTPHLSSIVNRMRWKSVA
jgi:DNA-binding MarR family transcriptional regulator